MKYKRRGSNQYQKKTNIHYVLWYLVFIAIMVSLGMFAKSTKQVNAQILSPVASSSATLAVEEQGVALSQPEVTTPVEEETTQYKEIKKEIYEVFGKHADKAMKVLSCENASLNPEAINKAGNYPVGSRDMGVFQINEYWQGVQGKFLLDPEINIRIAYKIFIDNGETFERWTCGRKFGI